MSNLDHALEGARAWLAEVAAEFGTDDKDFVYRITRVWLHSVRDRMTVIDAAHFAAQLPELLRGVFYENWDPAVVPVRRHADEFIAHFAAEAHITASEVPQVLWLVAAAFDRRMSGMDKLLNRLPREIRDLMAVK